VVALQAANRIREFGLGRGQVSARRRVITRARLRLLRDEFDAILFGALGDPRIPSNQHAPTFCLACAQARSVRQRSTGRMLHDPLTPLRDRTEKDIA